MKYRKLLVAVNVVISLLVYYAYLKVIINVTRVDIYLYFDTIGFVIAVLVNTLFIKVNKYVLPLAIAVILNIVINSIFMYENEFKIIIGVILLCNYLASLITAVFYYIKLKVLKSNIAAKT